MNEIEWDDPKKQPMGEVTWDAPKMPDVSALDAGMISAGHWLDKKAAGLREAVGGIPLVGRGIVAGLDSVDRMTGAKTPNAADYRSGANDRAMAPIREQHPVASFVGDFVPSALAANPLSMGVMGAMDPGSIGDRAMGAGLGYGAGKVGEYAGGKIADAFAKRAATQAAGRATAQAQNAPRDATIAAAQEAGYVLPPDQVNPNAINRVLTGIAGKASTQQGMAVKNEAVTLALAKKELSIPDDAPLTKETIATVRNTAGRAYEALKGFGKIKADDEYAQALGGMTTEYRALVTDFPELANNKIDGLVQTLSKPEFNSASAVELVKRLRKDGKSNMKAFDDPEKQALGKVQLDATKAVEDLMDRNLEASGNAGFLDIFRRARTLIAKSHAVEDALEESTGKVVAGKVKGDYLTGGLKTIANTHEAFPKSLQNINTPMPGMSPLDFLAGLAGGQAHGAAVGLGIPFARPAIRGVLSSGLYQKAMAGAPSYEAGAFERLLKSLGDDPERTKRLGGLLGLGGLQASR